MRNLKVILSIIIIILVSFHAKSAESRWDITGQIVDGQTQETLPYVTITLNVQSDSSLVTGTISDANGEFILEKVAKGNYYIKLSFIGFADQFVNDISFKKDLKTVSLGKIVLDHSSSLLGEVDITSRVSPVSNKIDKQVINVDKNISAKGGTAVDALRLSPSVQVDGDGNVKLRGSTKFLVLINGKPTSLTPDEVLRQTPANMISNIEVITNPSVKYSAEGGAGIININLKKGIVRGINGMINASVGTKNKYSGDFSLNMNRKKVNLSLGIDWRDWNQTANHNYYRDLFKGDTVHHATMFQDRLMNESNLGFRFGLDYNPNEKNNVSYSFHTGYTSIEGDIIARTSGNSEPASINKYNYNTYYFLQKPTFYTNNLGYTRQLKKEGSSFSLNLYYSYIDYYLLTSQIQSEADYNYNIIDMFPYKQDIINDNYSNDIRVDADFVQPLSEKTSLETGASIHSYNRFLDVVYSQFDHESNQWVNNPNYTNKYNFDETVYAAYANIKTSFLGLNTSIGLRTEYMDRLLKRKDENEGYSYEKVNFFPAFSVSKALSETQNISLTMTNRTNRPDEYMMNPFPEFEDDYFYAEGNPYLVPEIIRNLELSYQFASENIMASSNIFYRQTTDKLEQRLWIEDDDKIHTSFHNDCRDRTFGIELMGNFNIASWWDLNASGSLYHYTIEGEVFDDPFKRQRISWNFQMANSFNITKTTSLQLIGYYAGPTARSQGELSEVYFMDLALQQQFLDGKLSLNLQLKDILQSMNYELTTQTSNMNLLGDFNNESPILIFSVSYQISKYHKKTRDVETEFDM